MAAPMWRMNGLWKRMAGVLVLCALLLSNEVLCQGDNTSTPTSTSTVPASKATAIPPVVTTVGDAAHQSASTATPGDDSVPLATGPNQVGDALGTSGTPAASTQPHVVPAVIQIIKLVVPDVKCVGEDILDEFIMSNVATTNCEETKRIIQENPAAWCQKQNCLLKIFQDGNSMKLTSDDAPLPSMLNTLQSTHLKDQLNATNAVVNPSSSSLSSSGSSVFVGILVSGLLAALAITVGYCKCQRRTDTKGVRLAEEAYPVDQENQGNTLVSVAPLNPPPETQEKPSVNGESPEAAKTQPPPPTNGHSTTKTADTEL
ncbi:uncharacterized protein si:dkey-261h17.1 [Morone saxatilis]|uniref:uncharacterized protein si:dkey-261h17.1 n=1 Tax=Morone saxatilis TaxID=34816 RepID=UPI0015E23FA3|nr:uncharacterized protein si:dkey-261h17.1 [Morone saxatilis]